MPPHWAAGRTFWAPTSDRPIEPDRALAGALGGEDRIGQPELERTRLRLLSLGRRDQPKSGDRGHPEQGREPAPQDPPRERRRAIAYPPTAAAVPAITSQSIPPSPSRLGATAPATPASAEPEPPPEASP